jgi:hypothetical protein
VEVRGSGVGVERPFIPVEVFIFLHLPYGQRQVQTEGRDRAISTQLGVEGLQFS